MSRVDPSVYVHYEKREAKNSHHLIAFTEMKNPPFHNRTFLTATIWKKLSEAPATYAWVTAPLDTHPSVKPEDERHAVRAEIHRCVRLTAVGEASDITKFEYAVSLDLKGHVPKRLIQGIAVPAAMGLAYAVQQYFLQIKPRAACKAQDGVWVGLMLMDIASSGKHAAANLATFIARTDMLASASRSDCPFPHQYAMLQAMAMMKRSRAKAIGVRRPKLLSEEQSRAIGESFRSIILGHTDPAKAAHEFIRNYPALQRMDREHSWFRPMIETMAARAMLIALDVHLRLVVNTLLGMLDVGSDIAAMAIYFGSGQVAPAAAIASLVLSSIMVQALVVAFQNKHRGRAAMATEALILLSFFKPVVDLRRQVLGHKVIGAPFTVTEERSLCKVAELACESLPSALAQLVFTLPSEDPGWVPLISIAFSFVGAAAAVHNIAVNCDTDPRARKETPHFYGYVPDAPNWCAMCKAFLFVFVLTHIVNRTVSIALLALTNRTWLAGFVGVDMALFLVYKAVRFDVYFWVPGMGLAGSLVCRFACPLASIQLHGSFFAPTDRRPKPYSIVE